MGLDKAIASGKERRRPYRGSARFDRTCRPHGGGGRTPCKWCERARLIHEKRQQAAERIEQQEAEDGQG